MVVDQFFVLVFQLLNSSGLPRVVLRPDFLLVLKVCFGIILDLLHRFLKLDLSVVGDLVHLVNRAQVVDVGHNNVQQTQSD